MNAPFETPVAAIVAIMGLPFFLVIVRKGGKAFSRSKPRYLESNVSLYLSYLH